MMTQNIISTPNITGNVGSCSSEAVKVIERSGLMKDTGYTVVTNSCTGAVEKYGYLSYNAGQFIGIVVIIGIVSMFVILGSISLAVRD